MLKTISFAIIGSFLVVAVAQAAPVINVRDVITQTATGSVSHEITVSNAGDTAAIDVFVRKTLDSDLNFVLSEPAPDTSATADSQLTLIWNIPTLLAGAEFSADIQTTLKPGVVVGTVIGDTVVVEGDNFSAVTSASSVLAGTATVFIDPGVLGGAGAPITGALPTTGASPMALMLVVAVMALWPLNKKINGLISPFIS